MSAMSEKATVRSGSIRTVAATVGALWLSTGLAIAHGAFMDVADVRAVKIHARYDTGEPMAEAQVLVYAPDNPARPWARGVTDAEGRFSFVPDDRPGQWAIQARQAGHGAMSYFTVADAGAAVSVSVPARAGPDLAQRLLMVACVAWGCIGTALYFRRTHRERAA